LPHRAETGKPYPQRLHAESDRLAIRQA
jgi:hypothetical protein